jgi:eukaryotic-like serine/threonine-protein kinase
VLEAEVASAIGTDRFLREIEIAARFQHPHILALHESGDSGGFLYYVMPYVEGESLRQRLVREKQLPLDDALQITRAVGSALSPPLLLVDPLYAPLRGNPRFERLVAAR